MRDRISDKAKQTENYQVDIEAAKFLDIWQIAKLETLPSTSH